jgi:hypothetical protein
LKVQIVRQRAIIKDALDTGQRLEMAESLLDALEANLRIFEKHRVLILGQKKAPGSRLGLGLTKHLEANSRRSDTIPRHKSGKARIA